MFWTQEGIDLNATLLYLLEAPLRSNGDVLPLALSKVYRRGGGVILLRRAGDALSIVCLLA